MLSASVVLRLLLPPFPLLLCQDTGCAIGGCETDFVGPVLFSVSVVGAARPTDFEGLVLFSVTTVCAACSFSQRQVLSCYSLWLVATKVAVSAVAELTRGIFSPGYATHKSVQLGFYGIPSPPAQLRTRRHLCSGFSRLLLDTAMEPGQPRPVLRMRPESVSPSTRCIKKKKRRTRLSCCLKSVPSNDGITSPRPSPYCRGSLLVVSTEEDSTGLTKGNGVPSRQSRVGV